ALAAFPYGYARGQNPNFSWRGRNKVSIVILVPIFIMLRKSRLAILVGFLLQHHFPMSLSSNNDHSITSSIINPINKINMLFELSSRLSMLHALNWHIIQARLQ